MVVNQLRPPYILLISCPYQQSAITFHEITEYLTYNQFITTNTSTFLNPIQPIHWSDVETSPQYIAFEKEFLSQTFSFQNDYTKQPFAVDTLMFPQSQGFAILENVWKK